MTSLDIYDIPREQVDVEGLANEFARYLKLNAIDAQMLSEHPQQRDALFAELQAHPDIKPSFWPHDTVGADLPPERYDEYLAQVNAAIEQLSPPSSLKDRVLRAHLVLAATMVFTEYKWANPLRNHPDLREQVCVRYNAIFRDFMDNEFHTLFPSNGNGTARNPAPTTPPNAPSPNPLSPPPAHHSGKPKVITPSEVSGYLNDPQTLLGKWQFLHAPPPDVEQDFKGSWEAESYSVRMRDGHIDHEFLIRLEVFGAAPLPMSKDDVEFLLEHSTLV